MPTIVVKRPELSPAERAKRMETIKQAAIRLVIETEKVKRQKSRST